MTDPALTKPSPPALQASLDQPGSRGLPQYRLRDRPEWPESLESLQLQALLSVQPLTVPEGPPTLSRSRWQTPMRR
jgi:hypothetical protein